LAAAVPPKPDQRQYDELIKALIEGEASGNGPRTIRDIIADAEAKGSRMR
jgi:hypothetical protein